MAEHYPVCLKSPMFKQTIHAFYPPNNTVLYQRCLANSFLACSTAQAVLHSLVCAVLLAWTNPRLSTVVRLNQPSPVLCCWSEPTLACPVLLAWTNPRLPSVARLNQPSPAQWCWPEPSPACSVLLAWVNPRLCCVAHLNHPSPIQCVSPELFFACVVLLAWIIARLSSVARLNQLSPAHVVLTPTNCPSLCAIIASLRAIASGISVKPLSALKTKKRKYWLHHLPKDHLSFKFRFNWLKYI